MVHIGLRAVLLSYLHSSDSNLHPIRKNPFIYLTSIVQEIQFWQFIKVMDCKQNEWIDVSYGLIIRVRLVDASDAFLKAVTMRSYT
jgi:hypothetical protein